MTGRRDALLLAGVGVAAAAAGLLAGPLVLQARSGVPELLASSFSDLSGHPRRLADARQPLLACNFWATWCEPSRAEAPLLEALHRKWSASGLGMVGIGIDQADKMRRFAANFGLTYEILVAGWDLLPTLEKLGNPTGALPYTVLLGPRRSVQYRKLGLLRAGDLDPVIAAHLG